MTHDFTKNLHNVYVYLTAIYFLLRYNKVKLQEEFMKTIAEKSGGALFLLFLGIVVSVLFGVISMIVQAKGWGIFFAFSVLFFIAAVCGIVYELRRPKVLIKTDFKGLCSIGRTKTKSGRAETDKSKLSRKRVLNYPKKWRQNVLQQNKEMILIYFTQHSALKLEKTKFLCYNTFNSISIGILKLQE